MSTVTTLTADDVALERASVLEEARAWLGTPFHHRARVMGAGVDCAQFLIACYVGRGIVEPFDPGFYSPDWFLHEDGERFRGWVARSCVETETPAPGDLMLFRYGRAESHGAIYLGENRVIHSFRRQGVIEEECGRGSPLLARHASTWMPGRWYLGPRPHAAIGDTP